MTAGVPASCYRLQLGPALRFADVLALVPYLDQLGVTHLYLSPILMAVPGSTHGYDVTDPTRVNPDLGTEDELRTLAAALRARGMGIVLDIVPNHMCVAHSSNRWWDDVLENGPGSPYASTFDIDWRSPKAELADKVLLPVLGDQFGRVLEEGKVRVGFEDGALHVQLDGRRLPLGPRTWTAVLEPALEQVRSELPDDDPHRLELESVITALGYLPPRNDFDPERVRERQREKEVVRRRLDALVGASDAVRRAVEGAVIALNGRPGEPRSFDRLEQLLADQAYRLCYWRVAADEINYRRFFDINELAAIRVEDPEVFARVHEVVLRLVRDGVVQGLRVDHVDGLLDPLGYLRDLQERCRAARGGDAPFHVLVEKVLAPGERLPEEWPVAGTTGYDHLALQNGLFVDRARRRALLAAYERFAGRQRRFADVLNTSKKLIMLVGMASELHVLTCRLDRISEQHRASRDFTRESLRFALREVVASFPVYRTYVRPGDDRVAAEDRAHVLTAIEDAKRRNPATHASIFDFLRGVLLLEDPGGLDEVARAERLEFVLRLQQLTGPVMAKGLEDTAFYRYFPLASLAEVGGEPTRFGGGAAEVHRGNAARAASHPRSLLATTTHDTKRSEDVRARLNVLSEVPEQWFAAICRWRDLARGHETEVDGRAAPDPNDAYLLFQTLVGAFPLREEAADERLPRFRERIQAYMLKALREAKLHTSWIEPNAAYEAAALRLVDALLDPSPRNGFLPDLRRFVDEVAFPGALNGLAQVLLKAGSPGVPDVYQGTELWTLTLVDPDNRQPVDFARRAELLAELDRRAAQDRGALARDLLARWADGEVKLYVTSVALRLRRARRALFERGEYVGLRSTGPRARHVFAFLRRDAATGEHALVAVPRLLARLLPRVGVPVGPGPWAGTRLILPDGSPGAWRNALTGEVVSADEGDLPAGRLFATFPVALLHAPG